MPDTDVRLENVEQGLKKLADRMEERFEQVDQRFEEVDQRFAQVDKRFDSLEADVQKLRVLGEQNTTDIRRIAEVQVHHGEVLAEHGAALQRIEKALEPLKVLPTVIQNVLPHHERRITALEAASSAG